MQVDITEAKRRLSTLLDRAASGEDVVIARAGKPVARLVPLHEGGSRRGVRLGGLRKLRNRIPDAFHARLSDDDLVGA